MNLFQMPMGNQINNPMKMNNQMEIGMNNMMNKLNPNNNQMGMDNQIKMKLKFLGKNIIQIKKEKFLLF